MSSEQQAIDEQKRLAQLAGANAAMEIATKIQEGQPPATQDIVRVLESAETALDRQKLSTHVDEKGKTIIRDTENLLGATYACPVSFSVCDSLGALTHPCPLLRKELLQAKNPDDRLQKIVMEAREAGKVGGECACLTNALGFWFLWR